MSEKRPGDAEPVEPEPTDGLSADAGAADAGDPPPEVVGADAELPPVTPDAEAAIDAELPPAATAGAEAADLDLPPVATDCWPTGEQVADPAPDSPAGPDATPATPLAGAGTPDRVADDGTAGTEAAATAAVGAAGKLTGTRGKHAAPRHRIWTALWFIPEPMNDKWWRSWFFRSLLLLTGVLLLTGLFIAAYVGGLHNPIARDIPVGVVKGDTAAHEAMAKLRDRSTSLTTVEYADRAAAETALQKHRIYAVLSFTADATTPPDPAQPAPATGAELTVGTAGGPSAVLVITSTLTTAMDAAGIPLTVTDIAPLGAEDPHGLAPFYLVVGLVVGGYLAATVLALSTGTVPRNFERATIRLAALAVYSALAGLIGALVTSKILHVWDDHVLGLTLAGALIVFATATAASALSGWLGMAGTGVAILLFVILGNPGSGGIYAPELLPSFFRSLHHWVLPGLGTDLTRAVVYFDGKGPGRAVTGLVTYAAIGVAGLLAATAVLGKRGDR